MTTQLSSQDKRLGRERYLAFTRLNGVSFCCLGDSILTLYAIKCGLDLFWVGSLSSFIYVAMPFMLFGKSLLRQVGAARTMGLGWFMRNASALLLVLAPVVSPPPLSAFGTILFLVGAFGFSAFRSVGMTGQTPILGEVVESGRQGSYVSRMSLAFSGAVVVSLTALTLLLRSTDSLLAYRWILLFGCAIGLVSVFVVWRVPETDVPRNSASTPLLESLRKLWADSRQRKFLFSWSAAMAGLMLVFPFSTLALKNGYMVSDHQVLFYTLVQYGGRIVCAYLCAMVMDHSGPRPILIVSSGTCAAIALAWILAPGNYHTAFPVAVFTVVGAVFVMIVSACQHYFLSITSDEDRVGMGLLTTLITGLVAGLFGSVVGAGILKLIQSHGYEGLPLYRMYFQVVLVLCIPLFILVVRSERLKEWKVTSIVGLLFSFRDMRAIYTLSRISEEATPEKDEQSIRSLATLGSDLSEDTILGYLDSPIFSIRFKAINALGQLTRLSDRAVDALLNELRQNTYTTAYTAADVLGESGQTRVIPHLRQALATDDLYLKSKCMLALARLGDRDSLPGILELFRETDNPRLLIYGALSILSFGDASLGGEILGKLREPLPDRVCDEMLFCYAQLHGCGEEFYLLLRDYAVSPSNALRTLATRAERNVAKGVPMSEMAFTSLMSRKPPRKFNALRQLIEDAASPVPARLAYDQIHEFMGECSGRPVPDNILLCLALVLIVEP